MQTWLVCGGRDFDNYQFVSYTLDKLCIERSTCYNPDDNWLPSDIKIIHGGARGADHCADQWAVVNWCQFQEFPAQWDKYGKRAGYLRNQQMLDEGKPDLVIAFPGGRGTKMMVDIARKAGVEVIEVSLGPPYSDIISHFWRFVK